MKFLTILTSLGCVAAFAPVNQPSTAITTNTQLEMHRRDFMYAGLMGLVAQPAISHAAGSTFFFDDKIELVQEEAQMRTGNRIDVNNAFVVS